MEVKSKCSFRNINNGVNPYSAIARSAVVCISPNITNNVGTVNVTITAITIFQSVYIRSSIFSGTNNLLSVSYLGTIRKTHYPRCCNHIPDPCQNIN